MQETDYFNFGSDEVVYEIEKEWKGHPVSRVVFQHMLEEPVHLLSKWPVMELKQKLKN